MARQIHLQAQDPSNANAVIAVVETASRNGWHRYVRPTVLRLVTMDKQLFERFAQGQGRIRNRDGIQVHSSVTTDARGETDRSHRVKMLNEFLKDADALIQDRNAVH